MLFVFNGRCSDAAVKNHPPTKHFSGYGELGFFDTFPAPGLLNVLLLTSLWAPLMAHEHYAIAQNERVWEIQIDMKLRRENKICL